jgi:hypothetical protein
MNTIEELEAALAALLTSAPQILTDAQGEGSLTKYVKLAGDALSVAQTFATAVSSHPAVAATATTPAA